MKRFIIITIMIFLLTGCNSKDKNNESNIKITSNEVNLVLKENTLTNDEATFILVNNSPESIFYGDAFHLERKIKGKWYTLEMKEKVNFYLQPHELKQDEFIEIKINFTDLYGKLENGLYRFVKSYKYNNSNEELYTGVEFLIS